MNKQSLMNCIRTATLAVLAAIPGMCSTLTNEKLAALAGSATSGTDVGFLELFAGGSSSAPQPSFTFSSVAANPTWSTWSAALTGQLLGSPIDLAYAGDIMGNTITWTTSGSYDAINVTGGGSSTISYPTSSTFLLSFSDTLVSGAGAYSIAGNLNGSINANGTFGLGSSGTTEVEVGPFPILFNGNATTNSDWYSFWQDPNQADPNFYHDDIKYAWWLPKINTSGWFSSTTSFNDSAVPEPKTDLLLGAGLLLLAFAMRKRIPEN